MLQATGLRSLYAVAVIHVQPRGMAGRVQGARPLRGMKRKFCAFVRPARALASRRVNEWGQKQAEGASSNGIPGQDVEVHRLRGGLRLYVRGADVFPRQAVQERTQTVQEL